MSQLNKKRFSIFDSSIRLSHREFYEEVVSELNGIFPICNQGECRAMDITDTTTEQEQISGLMKKVESFSKELLDVNKRLFDQYYVAKEALSHSILSAIAYNKINTLDRNLLERTCDVRWWSLETSFGACIEAYTTFKKMLGGLKVTTGMPQEIIKLKKQSYVILQYNQCDMYEMLFSKLELTEEEGKKRDKLVTAITKLGELINNACYRLEDIKNSYTLYRDLVITCSDGYVIANSNEDRREQVLGLNVSKETWLKEALKTNNGTEYYSQDVTKSMLEEESMSLIYSTAVRENSDENGAVIGAMGVLFDFQNETSIILHDNMPQDENGLSIDGCYSMITNESGVIIASSDTVMLPEGSGARLPRYNRNLAFGRKTVAYITFEGVESAVFSAKTDGYLDYEGLGWTTHVIIPKSRIFENSSMNENVEIDSEELMNSKIIPVINKQTYLKIQDDKESIQHISLNGIVFASKLGKRGATLEPIFNKITATGDFVTAKMEELLKEMAQGELELNLEALKNFSIQCIDLIDRNLFERAADIRWWATDSYFWEALMSPSEESFDKASGRLKVINGSYTMYRNLVLADSNGDIVACSRAELKNELKKINVSDQLWFQAGLRTTSSSEFAVQDVQKTVLEKKENNSLIYSGGVRTGGERKGDSIGVLGVLFDWDTEARQILETCLPQDVKGERIDGAAAIYTNKENVIIETSDSEKFPLGKVMNFPSAVRNLGKGESASGVCEIDGEKFIYGSSRTKGYREYEGLGWCAHILRPIY